MGEHPPGRNRGRFQEHRDVQGSALHLNEQLRDEEWILLVTPDRRAFFLQVLPTRTRGVRAFSGAPTQCAREKRAGVSTVDDGRLFGFESELERSLTYLPLAMRFKLDRCGVKLSLAAWQQLSEHRRRELLSLPCHSEADVASYRRVLYAFVTECAGEEPATITVSTHPPWADDHVPDQLTRAATAGGFSSPSALQWRRLTPLERFALVKLSREGHEHRNLGAAFREFGLL